jgi:cytochrome c oxidase subunit 1/cytochrome c oxidase subunit I+III
MFIGFNVAFLPMHLSGLLGMPRRVYTYPADMGWNTLNMITTIGSYIFAVGVLLLFINVVISLRRGAVAGPNPWNAPTLEWSVSSPPPEYNFAVIPTVASRHPLWEDQLNEGPERSVLDRGWVLDKGREALAVTPLDSEPELILKMPEDSYAPFLLTVAAAGIFVGALGHWWWLSGLGVAGVLVALIVWLWPSRELAQRAGAVR